MSDMRTGDQDKQPNPVKAAIGKMTAKIRADDDMMDVLNALLALHPAAIEKCTPAEARAQPNPADAVKKVLEDRGHSTDPNDLVPGVSTRELSIPGPAGAMRACCYSPDPTGTQRLPVIVYYHGGGWVIADLDVYDAGARGLSAACQSVVISIDYRRAPEAKFPAAWDDALAAYRWAVENAQSLGGDGVRFGLAGESAGGCLAVATAIAARDAGVTAPRHVLSVYPIAQGESFSTASYLENAAAMPLNRAMMEWFMSYVLRGDDDKRDPRLDLIHANLAGLPPVTILNAALDPLRSDGEMLAKALQEAGVDCSQTTFDGVTHEFFGMAAVVSKARDAQSLGASRMRRSFERGAH